MLRVEISVNGKVIGSETALRIKGGDDSEDINTYLLNDQSTIKHRYGDGAAKLAEKMMGHLHKTRKRI